MQLCQQEGIENCRRIELHPEALAMEEIDIMGNYYKKSHVVDKDEQTMYGYEASRSQYRLSHLLMDLGWVDFDLGVPPSCPAAQPLLPNYHQPKQSYIDSGTLKNQVNPTLSRSRWVTLKK